MKCSTLVHKMKRVISLLSWVSVVEYSLLLVIHLNIFVISLQIYLFCRCNLSEVRLADLNRHLYIGALGDVRLSEGPWQGVQGAKVSQGRGDLLPV